MPFYTSDEIKNRQSDVGHGGLKKKKKKEEKEEEMWKKRKNKSYVPLVKVFTPRSR